jgi:hypothetical protein
MPLTGAQIKRLADELDRQWDLPTLKLFTSDHLDVNLDNLTPDGSLKERAVKLITYLNSQLPPRDRELLEKLRVRQNTPLRNVANELLKPPFFAPRSDDPHDAIVLGRAAFVDRAQLREKLREFTNPSPNTTRVLIIRGDEPCGKSYSWAFLRHLAATTVGAIPQRLQLSGTSYTPKQFMEQAFALLGLNQAALPPMTDDPQLARIDPLINAFRGQIVQLQRRYWLVIDDLNDPSVTPLIRETAYAIAFSVEDIRPDDLWVALLGYNAQITDPELQWVAQDDARFPDGALLAEHFQHMAEVGPLPLTRQRAREYADLLLAKFPELTKEAMTSLTPLIGEMGEKLQLGERP